MVDNSTSLTDNATEDTLKTLIHCFFGTDSHSNINPFLGEKFSNLKNKPTLQTIQILVFMK